MYVEIFDEDRFRLVVRADRKIHPRRADRVLARPLRKAIKGSEFNPSNPPDTRICNPRSASNTREHKRILPLCHYFATN
jgi:hypothetical protein